ncbi:hypothetical protein SKB0123_04230 [Staphylococcus capitis]|nr:hypothetical protein GCM10008141_12300 [Staphylococcus capitis]
MLFDFIRNILHLTLTNVSDIINITLPLPQNRLHMMYKITSTYHLGDLYILTLIISKCNKLLTIFKGLLQISSATSP